MKKIYLKLLFKSVGPVECTKYSLWHHTVLMTPYEIVVLEQLYAVMSKKFGNIWKEEWKNIRTIFT